LVSSRSNFILGDEASQPPQEIIKLLEEFRTEINTFEAKKEMPFALFQDGASKAYYTECHIGARVAAPLIDLEAAIDPEQQEEFRLQRKLQPKNRAFIRMCTDALQCREFSDLMAEYDTSYRPDKPLKLLGGQHRAVAIQRALDKKVSRYHGFKIYFGLTREQRSEIAQIANTNIAISLDILDRIQETTMGPNLRDFCHKVGLLKKREDFADRKNPEGKITVRLARTFLVNFFEGLRNKGELDGNLFYPDVCKTGSELDPKYGSLITDRGIWSDKRLIEAGREFAVLHKAQVKAIEKDKKLRKYVEFRNKAVSMSVLASWSHAAGLLQRDTARLQKFYSLPKLSKTDPLKARDMSEARHHTDPETYRGLGTRMDRKDIGRLVELWLQFSRSQERTITPQLIDSAIKTYEANVSTEVARKAQRRARV